MYSTGHELHQLLVIPLSRIWTHWAAPPRPKLLPTQRTKSMRGRFAFPSPVSGGNVMTGARQPGDDICFLVSFIHFVRAILGTTTALPPEGTCDNECCLNILMGNLSGIDSIRPPFTESADHQCDKKEGRVPISHTGHSGVFARRGFRCPHSVLCTPYRMAMTGGYLPTPSTRTVSHHRCCTYST